MEATNEDKQGESGSTEPGKIKLQIRTARVQKFITVDEATNVKDLRSKAAELFEVGDPSLTVLIFGGKILKDNEDIKMHGIKDSQTIHLVIRNKPSGDTPSAANTGMNLMNQQQSTTTNASNINNLNIPLNNNRLDQSSNPLVGNLADVQQRLQQMLISNPETMQSMINPMIQQMMNNPEMLRSLLGSMQRMQTLMERNPEVNHLLSNPDVLRESLEMVRNPAALQEVMRNYDRALNNMESMPGGYNVLRRMYTEFQEPLLSAFQEQFNTNQFGPTQPNSDNANGPANATGEGEQQRTENRDPLPNPWASTTPSDRVSFPSMTGLNGADNLEGQGNTNTNTNELLQQANSMFQNPEFMSLLTDPEAIRSVEQIQQGFERLQRIAPNLFGRLGLPNMPRTNMTTANPEGNSNISSSEGNQQLGAAPNQDMMGQLFRQLMGSGGAGLGANLGSTNTTTGTPNPNQPADAARMLSQLLGGTRNTGGSVPGLVPEGVDNGQSPEERYSQQLQQLSEMGFPNRAANLQALIATFGDINAAIARLLQ